MRLLDLLCISGTFSNVKGKGSHSMRHFCFLTGLYLLNIGYAYMHLKWNVDWGLYYLPPYSLYILNVVIGIWGFYSQPSYNYHFTSLRSKRLFYLSLCVISLGGAMMAGFSLNSSMIESYNDIILYTHIGFGISFTLYVLFNYGELFLHNKPVYKVLYSHERVNFFSTILIALILITILVVKIRFNPIKRFVASHYASVGNLHKLRGEEKIAYSYYKEVLSKDLFSFYPNYVMALKDLNDRYRAIELIENANFRTPNPHTHSYISSIYLNNRRIFDALFESRKGVEEYRANPELNFILSSRYSKINNIR